MTEPLKALVICGSLRKGSFNASVARALPALAPPELTLTPAPSFAGFPLYNADVQNASGIPADVVALAEAIRSADGVVFVSPEYNWSIPGVLKNAIDWLSRVKDQPFAFKPVALMSASGSPVGGARMQYHLRQTLNSLEAMILNRPEIFVSFANKKIDEKTLELTDQATKDVIKSQLEAFAKFIARVKTG
jgi:chromate reductase, NAD(P)H dehydrogenase (quinone)